MNFRTSCIWLSLIAATGILAMPLAAVGSSSTSSFEFKAGGQAPPSPAGGSGFAVRVAANLDQAAADSLKNDLVNEGFTAAEARIAAQGKYEVVIPGMATRAQAEGVVNDLKASGYTTSVEVVSEDTSEGASPASGETVYRVKVAEFDTPEQATEASKVLVDEGFVNVDVAEENGKHVLMLGTFNREADAKALLGDVNRAGFALATVVSKERLQTGTGTTADVSGLPAAEQGLARDVLAMAQKVESGEATAEEVKRLREMVQQLTSGQRAVLSQQESGRAATRDKNQRIFQLYRDFQKAVSAKQYDRAEQILNEVRQIDPDDIFLSQRVATLENLRAGGSSAAGTARPSTPDPAQIQTLINEARAAATAGNNSLATQKYNQVLALDPANVEAKTQLAALGGSAPAGEQADAGTDGGLLENKPLIYGAAGAVVLIILLLLWMKSRGKEQKSPTPATGTAFGSTEYGEPLGSGGFGASASAANTPGEGVGSGLAGGLAGAGMVGVSAYPTSDEETAEEEELTPAPKPSPAPVAQENEVVSLEEFGSEPQATAAKPVPAAPEDEIVSLNFDEEPQQPQAPATAAAEQAPSSSMDADLEALLKGTFGGSEPEAGPSTAAVAGAGAAAGAAARLVFSQDFTSESTGESPSDWRGEYDYASLSVSELAEDGHERALKYEKQEGAGSATYHLSFPPVKGKVTAEFDIRCDEKNKFLLGVYLERDEDFKQSVHTIVHQLDPSAPASLRVQGEAVPYNMGEWSHLKYEVDLNTGTLNAFMNDQHVVQNGELAVVPEYLNTLSIRDNLATTGILYIDNIRISEG